ncbi:hypothetical protein JHW43_006519 [Diplocarpon mali]|nr:hypothetical protein JHW43_006519 [Diplocarpon mali]
MPAGEEGSRCMSTVAGWLSSRCFGRFFFSFEAPQPELQRNNHLSSRGEHTHNSPRILSTRTHEAQSACEQGQIARANCALSAPNPRGGIVSARLGQVGSPFSREVGTYLACDERRNCSSGAPQEPNASFPPTTRNRASRLRSILCAGDFTAQGDTMQSHGGSDARTANEGTAGQSNTMRWETQPRSLRTLASCDINVMSIWPATKSPGEALCILRRRRSKQSPVSRMELRNLRNPCRIPPGSAREIAPDLDCYDHDGAQNPEIALDLSSQAHLKAADPRFQPFALGAE